MGSHHQVLLLLLNPHKMGKRQRNQEEGDEDIGAVPTTAQDPPSKKPRKETNASAQRTLFVRSLPAIATSDALTELFSQNYPLKHATVVLDPETKQSKGYGFVTLADAEDAQRALDEFNGQTFLGRKMKIEIAQPRSREMSKGDGLEGKRKSTISAEAAAIKKARLDKMAEDKKPPKLIIRNLPWSVNTPEKLAALFQGFGKVKFSVLPKNKDTQAGFGFITMRGKKNAEKALATVNGTLIDGRMVAVDWAVDKEVWETQNKSSKAEESDEDEGGVKLAEKKKKPAKKAAEKKPAEDSDGEDDVANFFKNFGDQLESEDEDDEDPKEDEEDEDEELDEEIKEEDEVWEDDAEEETEEEVEEEKPKKVLITDNSTTLFIRNLPFTTHDADLIQNNLTLHLSLTRLSLRNLPKNINSKDLKALAREAVVGFATDVKSGLRAQLSKEEEARGGDEMREAEKQRKAKGKGIVRQAKIVFEGREGAKVSEESGAGKSRGYGFVEYSSHRWALMGLRWLNGHAVENTATGKKQRLIVEFAIENAQVVQRRKEKEEKARLRSKEVMELRAKGEVPEKEKNVLRKSEVMKKTRVGMKGKPGRPGFGKKGEDGGKPQKSFERVDVGAAKRKRDGEEEGGAGKKAKKGKGGEKEEKKFKPGFPPGEEGRLQRREQIIQKKRMMRRKRKGGA